MCLSPTDWRHSKTGGAQSEVTKTFLQWTNKNTINANRRRAELSLTVREKNCLTFVSRLSLALPVHLPRILSWHFLCTAQLHTVTTHSNLSSAICMQQLISLIRMANRRFMLATHVRPADLLLCDHHYLLESVSKIFRISFLRPHAVTCLCLCDILCIFFQYKVQSFKVLKNWIKE